MSRDTQALHQTARARAKVELEAEIEEVVLEGDAGNRSIEVYDRATKEVVETIDCGLYDDATIEGIRTTMHGQMNLREFGTRVVKTPELKENGPRMG